MATPPLPLSKLENLLLSVSTVPDRNIAGISHSAVGEILSFDRKTFTGINVGRRVAS